MKAIIHIAGRPDPDEVQRCVFCRAVLQDNRPVVAPPSGELNANQILAAVRTGEHWYPMGRDVTEIRSDLNALVQITLETVDAVGYVIVRCTAL
jgi:hypothetical protein